MPKRSQPKFALCIDNSHYEASLELHKIYRVLPDRDAENERDLRVVDESGEDYLYSADRFLLVDFPKQTAQILKRSFDRADESAR